MTEFLKPVLKGTRFEGGAIPLEMLSDLSALREMIIDVAKWRYSEDHPDRKRLPSKFAQDVSLSLVGVSEGSAVPRIIMTGHARGVPSSPEFPGMPSESRTYLVKARDLIIADVDAAERGETSRIGLPPSTLRHFNRIGARLRDGESMGFQQPLNGRLARLTRDSRQRLIEASQIKEMTREVAVRGMISEMDQDRMSFEIQLSNERKLSGKILDHHFDTILDTFTAYGKHAKVMIRGIGRYDSDQRVSKIEQIDDVTPLDPLDVPARLDELRVLRDGWLDGKGVALDGSGLDWLADSFENLYSLDASPPRLYPTPEGGVQAEWFINVYDASLEIDLETRKAEWHNLNFDTDVADERELDLNKPSDWDWLSNQVIALESSAT